MIKHNIPREVLNSITIEDAKGIYEKLINNYLEQKWLMHRLDHDYGIKVQRSAFSELLRGKRGIGRKMQLAIYLSQRIIWQYENTIPRRKK